MTGPGQQAFTSAAEVNRVESFNPATADKCALCGNSVGETDPRQFWGGPNNNPEGMLLVHTRCLRRYEMEHPPTTDAPVALPQAVISEPVPQPTNIVTAKNVSFASFDDMQNFIINNGQIPKTSSVYVNGVRIQTAGE